MHESSPNCFWIIGRSCFCGIFDTNLYYNDFGQNCERTTPLDEKQSHTLVVSGLVVGFTFSFPSQLILQMSQTARRENNSSTVFCCPILVLPRELHSVLGVFLGEKCLLRRPSWHQALVQKSFPHCADALTHLLLLLHTILSSSWCSPDSLGRPEAFFSALEVVEPLSFRMIGWFTWLVLVHTLPCADDLISGLVCCKHQRRSYDTAYLWIINV